MFREAVLAFLGVKGNVGNQKTATKDQGIGEYCRNKDLKECRKYFGAGLAQVCKRCPE